MLRGTLLWIRIVTKKSCTENNKQILVGFLLGTKTIDVSRYNCQLQFEQKNTLSTTTRKTVFFKPVIPSLRIIIFEKTMFFRTSKLVPASLTLAVNSSKVLHIVLELVNTAFGIP